MSKVTTAASREHLPDGIELGSRGVGPTLTLAPTNPTTTRMGTKAVRRRQGRLALTVPVAILLALGLERLGVSVDGIAGLTATVVLILQMTGWLPGNAAPPESNTETPPDPNELT